MIVWKYRTPTSDGPPRIAYGTPVTVYVPGLGEVQAVYQFGAPGQPCAVVEHRTGRIITLVGDYHSGAPQERARQAVREVPPRRLAAGFTEGAAPVINGLPGVVR